MSYEFPFSKPTGWSVRKAILLALVIGHAVWIIVHLNLVSRELINPWKLGGYGMYTVPHPSPAFTLFDRRFDGLEITVSKDDRKKLTWDNWFFVFRCRPITVASLQRYLRDNPRLVGIPLRFIFAEKKMVPESDPGPSTCRMQSLRYAGLGELRSIMQARSVANYTVANPN